jgi:hypothetical protein
MNVVMGLWKEGREEKENNEGEVYCFYEDGIMKPTKT